MIYERTSRTLEHPVALVSADLAGAAGGRSIGMAAMTKTKKRGSPLPRSVRVRPWTPLPPEPPVDQQIESAKKLPMFGPGIVIKTALPIQPAYMELYDLVPLNPGEVRDMEKELGHKKPDDILWVKRVPKQVKQ